MEPLFLFTHNFFLTTAANSLQLLPRTSVFLQSGNDLNVLIVRLQILFKQRKCFKPFSLYRLEKRNKQFEKIGFFISVISLFPCHFASLQRLTLHLLLVFFKTGSNQDQQYSNWFCFNQNFNDFLYERKEERRAEETFEK